MKLHRHNVLKITGCSDPLLWYSHMVGMHVPHEGFDVTDGYRSREQSGHVNFVRLQDATPVTVLVTDHSNGRWPFLKAVEQTRVHDSYIDPLPTEPVKPVQTHWQPTGQTRRASVIEAVVNTGTGFVLSVIITALLLPAMGHQVSTQENLMMTSVFTVASLARSYAVRRAFNHLHHTEAAHG